MLLHMYLEHSTYDLHLAVFLQFLDLAKYELEHGEDINVKEKDGNTALHIACFQTFHHDLIDLLLSYNPDMNAQNNMLLTPLNLFMRYSPADNFVLTVLLENGADPNLPDEDGNTPLHYLAQHSILPFIDSKTIADILFKFNPKLNIRNKNGNTPLHLAVRVGAVDFIKILLYKGASVLTKNEENLSPIDLAYTKIQDSPETFIEMGKFLTVMNICRVPTYQNLLNEIHSNENLQIIYAQCNEELLRLRNIKVGNSEVTLNVIVKSSTYAFAKYLRNPEILEWFLNFETEHCGIFGDRLKQHFKESLARKKAEEQGYPFCQQIFANLPEVYVDSLMTYLGNQDLCNLNEDTLMK